MSNTNRKLTATDRAEITARYAHQMQGWRVTDAAKEFRYAATHNAPETLVVEKFLKVLLTLGNVTGTRWGI
jgi:hypothetical protein